MKKSELKEIFKFFRIRLSWYIFIERGEVVNSRYLLHKRDFAMRIYNEALNRGMV
jgi:hypothetical protein